MIRIMLVTFLFLGWAFYELSGGSEFEAPEVASVTTLEQFDVADLPAEEPSAIRARVTPQPDIAITDQPATGVDARENADENANEDAVAQAADTAVETAVTEVSLNVPGSTELGAPQETNANDPVNGDLRRITGNRVNMRSGPGTNYPVVTQLRRDQVVELLQDPGSGWVKLRAEDGGSVGWMAKRFTAKQ